MGRLSSDLAHRFSVRKLGRSEFRIDAKFGFFEEQFEVRCRDAVVASSSGSTRRCSVTSIASPCAKDLWTESPNSRLTPIPGSKATMRKGRSSGDGASARRHADRPRRDAACERKMIAV
jgi:hypothetical protein